MDLFLKPRMLYSVENNISKKVLSDQQCMHPNLARVSNKHKDLLKYQNPIGAETARILKATQEQVERNSKPLVMDCGCGTGESAIRLAKKLADHTIVAIDKSSHRLSKAKNKYCPLPENLIFLRANLTDIWLYAYRHKWNIKNTDLCQMCDYHCYPNTKYFE